jgi:hypothetical protein
MPVVVVEDEELAQLEQEVSVVAVPVVVMQLLLE